MTTSTHARATDIRRAPSIRIASHSVTALAEAGARGHALSPVEIRAICEALQTNRARTHFHSGGF